MQNQRLQIALEKNLDAILEFLPVLLIRGVIIIFLISIWSNVIALILKALAKVLKRKKIDPLLESFTASIVTTLLYVVLFFIIVGIAGVKAASLITVLGTAGLAVGLALQGSLSNLAGGVLILFFKPFSKGDYIVSNAGVEGSVENIQILYTTLITADNKVIVVPNSQLANNAVTNVSRNPIRRLDMVFSVGYSSSTELVKELLTKIADNHPSVLKDKPYTIRMAVQNASSLDFYCRVWVNSGDYWTTKFDFNEIVKAEFDAHNIEIPYQKIDIYQK